MYYTWIDLIHRASTNGGRKCCVHYWHLFDSLYFFGKISGDEVLIQKAFRDSSGREPVFREDDECKSGFI